MYVINNQSKKFLKILNGLRKSYFLRLAMPTMEFLPACATSTSTLFVKGWHVKEKRDGEVELVN